MYWAWPGLKALAWAWLTRAWAYSNLRPGPDGGLRLGLGSGQGLMSKLYKSVYCQSRQHLMQFLILKLYI